MGKVNILGILIMALGVFLFWLGISGKYKVFVGAGTSSNPSPSTATTNPLPNQGDVIASNTAIPGVTFSTLNQNPVPTLGNLPNSISPQQKSIIQILWGLIQGGAPPP